MLSQVISQDIFTTWCGIYDHRLEKKNRTLYTFLFVFCPKKVAKLPSDEKFVTKLSSPFSGHGNCHKVFFFPNAQGIATVFTTLPREKNLEAKHLWFCVLVDKLSKLQWWQKISLKPPNLVP